MKKKEKLEKGELDFHLWCMMQEGLIYADKDNNYRLTELGQRLKEEGKTTEYINNYKHKYQKMLDEYEGEGFPPVDIPR